jgi:hypothetical protein
MNRFRTSPARRGAHSGGELFAARRSGSRPNRFDLRPLCRPCDSPRPACCLCCPRNPRSARSLFVMLVGLSPAPHRPENVCQTRLSATRSKTQVSSKCRSGVECVLCLVAGGMSPGKPWEMRSWRDQREGDRRRPNVPEGMGVDVWQSLTWRCGAPARSSAPPDAGPSELPARRQCLSRLAAGIQPPPACRIEARTNRFRQSPTPTVADVRRKGSA